VTDYALVNVYFYGPAENCLFKFNFYILADVCTPSVVSNDSRLIISLGPEIKELIELVPSLPLEVFLGLVGHVFPELVCLLSVFPLLVLVHGSVVLLLDFVPLVLIVAEGGLAGGTSGVEVLKASFCKPILLVVGVSLGVVAECFISLCYFFKLLLRVFLGI